MPYREANQPGCSEGRQITSHERQRNKKGRQHFEEKILAPGFRQVRKTGAELGKIAVHHRVTGSHVHERPPFPLSTGSTSRFRLAAKLFQQCAMATTCRRPAAVSQ